MPQVKYAPKAIQDLQRLREFLREKSPAAAKRAGEVISQHLKILGQQPQIGRLIEDMAPQFREWIIDYGDSGYVARYRFDGSQVVILAVRHQKEAGFTTEEK